MSPCDHIVNNKSKLRNSSDRKSSFTTETKFSNCHGICQVDLELPRIATHNLQKQQIKRAIHDELDN